MKRLGLVMAGAAIFDLGTVVATSHAEVSLNFAKIKWDAIHTASDCAGAGGTVVRERGKAFCTLANPKRATGGATGIWKITLTDVLVTSKAAPSISAPTSTPIPK